MKTAFFVDGYNLFYGLLANTNHKWLDLPKLLSHIASIQNPETIPAEFYYFSAPILPKLASRGIKSKEAQDTYIRVLKAQGVKIVLGRHQIVHAKAPKFVNKETPPSRDNQVEIWKLEEKETDVNIALAMYRLATKQLLEKSTQPFEQIILVSADTDLGPAIRALREDFPDLIIGVILPHREDSKRIAPGDFLKNAHWVRRRVTNIELLSHQLPEQFPTHKKPAFKPNYW